MLRMFTGMQAFERRFAAGGRLRWPETDVHRICVVLAGSFAEQRNCEVAFGRGSIVFRPSEERNHIRFGPEGMRSLTIEVSRPSAARMFEAGLLSGKPAELYSSECLHLAMRAAREVRSPDPSARFIVEGLLLEIVGQFSRCAALASNTPPSWLETVKKSVARDFRTPSSLAAYALQAGVHPVTLAKVFRKYEGCSVGDFMRGLRMERAADLLVQTQHGLTHIALESGFSDQAHMTRWFRRHYGMTPSEYRSNCRNAKPIQSGLDHSSNR